MKYFFWVFISIIVIISCSEEPLKESRISGKINYENGAPSDMVYIGLYPLSAKQFLGKYRQLKEITDNVFSFNVEPGLYTLAVYSFAFEPFRKNILIPDTSTQIEIKIELPRLSVPVKIDSVTLCGGKGRGLNWRIEKPMTLKNGKWIVDNRNLLKKGEKYQFKVNGSAVWDLADKEFYVNKPFATINSIYGTGEIVFDPSLYQKPKKTAACTCEGIEKKYDLRTLALALDSLSTETNRALHNISSMSFQKIDSLYQSVVKRYERLDKKYGPPLDQYILERRIYPLEYLNPISRELQLLFGKSKSDTSRLNKFYESDTFKAYINENIELFKQLDPSSFLLNGQFAMNYIWLHQLLENSSALQRLMGLPKDYFSVQLIDFADLTKNKKCAANILFATGMIYSRQKSPEAHNKAIFILDKLKRKYPNDKNVKNGYADKILRSLRVDSGRTAPDFSVRTVTGDSLTLANFRGKFVLLDFWGTWCAPCRQEIPNLINVYNTFSRDDLLVIGLAKDDPEKLKNYMKEKEIPYPNALANDKILKSYGIFAFPTTYLIAPDGIIIAKNLRGEDIVQKIREKMDDFYRNNK